jgi:hypothetical protein
MQCPILTSWSLPQMRRELGGISDMTTWRWDHDLANAPNGWELPIRIGSRRKYRTRGMIERVTT